VLRDHSRTDTAAMPPETEDSAGNTRRQTFESVREGRYVRLRPVRDLDRPFLYSLMTDKSVGVRWRFRGALPRPESFDRLLWEGILAQYVIEGRESGVTKGLVASWSANLNAGIANLGVLLAPEYMSHGTGIEAGILFARYLFDTWSLRKLYLEAPEFNCDQFGSAIGNYLHVEGILRDHDYYGGRYWDSYILAFYRADLERFETEHGTMLGQRGEGKSPTQRTKRSWRPRAESVEPGNSHD